jgi:Mrp family chromosome partitioning ATPase
MAMKIYQQALSKAKLEGKIDGKMLPWEGVDAEGAEPEIQHNIESLLPFHLMKFPEEVLNDLQRISVTLRSFSMEKNVRVVGFTSPVPEQGTSTIAVLLSLMMAGKSDGRFRRQNTEQIDLAPEFHTEAFDGEHGVLLIDTQVRHPSLHMMLETTLEGGLWELLRGELLPQEVMKRIESANLEVITLGEKRDHHYGERWIDSLKETLRNKRAQFAHILLDIPPILAYPEGILLGKLCEGIVLVLQAENTRSKVIQEAQKMIESSNVPLIGCVLNRRRYHLPEWIYERL